MLIGLLPTFFGLALILIHYLTRKNGNHEDIEEDAPEEDFENKATADEVQE